MSTELEGQKSEQLDAEKENLFSEFHFDHASLILEHQSTSNPSVAAM